MQGRDWETVTSGLRTKEEPAKETKREAKEKQCHLLQMSGVEVW